MMSFRRGIQQFLDDMDAVILSRGEDYYHSGQVENIIWEENYVTAEVSGSEEAPYLVEIDFSEDGEVEDWSCDCPYEWGPVCKHTAAVLLAIQAEAPEEPKKISRAAKIDIRPLLERAEKPQLAALILEHCQEDLRFQSRVLAELGDGGEQELAAVKALVKASIRSNTYRGYIDMKGCDNICADLDDALDQARRRAKGKQYERALDITLFVLLTAIKLAEEADGSSGSLSYTVDAALETVGLIASGLTAGGGKRKAVVGKILKTAEDPVFDGWDYWRYDLVQRAAALADRENEGEFYRLLDRLSDQQWEKFQDTPRYGYGEQDKITRYAILCSAQGPEVARAYLEKNLEVDEFRLILIRDEMEKRDYAHAERLCRERLEREQAEQRYRPSQWQYLLYEIYRDGGQREEQICQARRLALLGDRDFYQTTKELLTEDGRWPEIYPGFLAELKAARPAHEYMEILELEGEVPLLMEQVRLNPKSVFRYGDVLTAQYQKEVYSLCAAVIRKDSKQAGNRGEYRALCGLIKSLAGFGGQAEAKAIIAELRQRYPRRPALLDELGRV